MLARGVTWGLGRAWREERNEELGEMGMGGCGEGEAQGLGTVGSVQSERGTPS